MSTRTSRLSLYKPAATGENVNVVTDLNDNLDIIDALMSFVPVTTGTYPASGYRGEGFYETDTGRAWINTGISGSALVLVQIPVADSTFASNISLSGSTRQIIIGDSTSSANFTARRGLSTDNIVSGQVHSASAFSSFVIQAGGAMRWGSGTSDLDTNLYRTAADTLRTDDSFTVDGNLTVAGSTTMDDAIVGGNLVIGSAYYRPNLFSTVTLANTVTETALATFTIAASEAVVGAVYRIKIYGTLAVTGTPTMTFRSRLGGAAGTQLVALGAITVRSGATDGQWSAEALVTCTATGASGTWSPMLKVEHNFITSATTYTPLGPGTVSPVTKDTTVSNAFVITGTWSAASPSNTMTARGGYLERVA